MIILQVDLEARRIKTGITGLDRLLKGGLPIGSITLVVGVPGSGKTTFARQVMNTTLSEGQKCIYITTAEPPSAITKQMKIMGWDVSKYKKSARFIDCYSWRVSQSQREKTDYQLSSITNLNELDVFLSKAINELGMEKTGGLVVLDSITDLLLHCETTPVFKLMQLLTGKVKAARGNALFLVEEGVHDERQIATLNYITDGTIQMRLDLDKRNLRISRMIDTQHPMAWMPFEIGVGLEVKVEEFFK